MKGAKRNMARWLALCVAIILLIGSFGSVGVHGTQSTPLQIKDLMLREPAPGDYDGYIVKLKDDVSFSAGNKDGIEKLEYVDATYTAESIEAIEEDIPLESVEYIEPDYEVELFDSAKSSVEPNDKYYKSDQWYLPMVNVDKAWMHGLEGQGATVAVVDSGLKYKHEDFDYNRILQGKNFVSTPVNDTDDKIGHGTMVSGIITASKDNEVGIAGILQEIELLPLKVFVSRTTQTSTIVNAINYAIDKEVDVINLSLGSESSSETMKKACDRAEQEDIFVIAAAGNDGNSAPSYPAQYESVVGVGSVTSKEAVSWFSQRGKEKVFVTAPGEEITSTYYKATDSYAESDGTSFSAPIVTALAGLAKSIDPELTMGEFQDLLIKTSKDIGTPGRDDLFGYGLIDFKAFSQEMLNDESENKRKIDFSVFNGLGNEVEDAKITVKKVGSETPITAESYGSYLLDDGDYTYTILADKYESQTAPFSVMRDRTVKVVLESAKYSTDFILKNTKGEDIGDTVNVTIENSQGREIDPEPGYTTKFALKNGNYYYEVTSTDYYPLKGTFNIEDDSWQEEVTLLGAFDIASVTFKLEDPDGKPINNGELRLYKDEEIIGTYKDGAYKLAPGTYSYEATANKYKAVKDTIEINESDKGNEKMVVTVRMNDPINWVFIDTSPSDADITVKNSENGIEMPVKRGEYKLSKGDYTYFIEKTGYTKKTAAFKVENRTVYLDIELTEEKAGPPPSGSNTDKPGDSGDEDKNLPEEPKDYTEVLKGYTDLNIGEWYYDSVGFVVESGFFEGASKTYFDVNTKMSRGMMATVLKRMGSTDKITLSSMEANKKFKDVKDGIWYAESVYWASNINIINGSSPDYYSPNDSVTREQIAAFLYRYAVQAGKDVSKVNIQILDEYNDGDRISSWAKAETAWAIEMGILKGFVDGSLEPKKEASRGEIAMMVSRYYEIN